MFGLKSMDAAALEREHGKRIRLPSGRWLFEDGSEADGDLTMLNPPSYGNALNGKRRFLAAKLEREESAFRRFKAEAMEQLAYRQKGWQVPAPGAEAAEQLKQGKQRIDALRSQIAEIDEQMRNSAAAQARDVRQQHEQDRLREVNDAIGAINSVNID